MNEVLVVRETTTTTKKKYAQYIESIIKVFILFFTSVFWEGGKKEAFVKSLKVLIL